MPDWNKKYLYSTFGMKEHKRLGNGFRCVSLNFLLVRSSWSNFSLLSVIEKDEKILIFFLGRTHKIRFVLLVDFVKVRIKEKEW